jgi:cytochrome P450
MKEGESHGKDDLLGLLLESNMRDTDEHGQSSMGMTIEDVIEECKLFYFAGMETTSVLLTWAMVLLCMHPEWQDRAREEVSGLFGKNKRNMMASVSNPRYWFTDNSIQQAEYRTSGGKGGRNQQVGE